MSSNASGEGWTAGRMATLAGPAGVAVSALGVLGSVVLASWLVGSWFTWTGNALSHLGDPQRATAPLFNYGLVVGGVLGAAFAARVGAAGTNTWHRVGAGTLAVGLLCSSLVGVFDVTEALHTPFALAYFVLLTLGLFAHGSGDAVAGRARRSVLTTWLAVAHVAGWVALAFVPFDGIALPELVGVVGLWTWTLTVYAGLRG
jgi:hypothetical membrane protein